MMVQIACGRCPVQANIFNHIVLHISTRLMGVCHIFTAAKEVVGRLCFHRCLFVHGEGEGMRGCGGGHVWQGTCG